MLQSHQSCMQFIRAIEGSNKMRNPTETRIFGPSLSELLKSGHTQKVDPLPES